MRGRWLSSSWLYRFIGLRLKSVSFEDSLFEECYFEDVTSSNTFFRNCTFINTVFYNTGKVGWLEADRTKDWVDPELEKGNLLHSLTQSSQAELFRALEVMGGLLVTTSNYKNLMVIDHFSVISRTSDENIKFVCFWLELKQLNIVILMHF